MSSACIPTDGTRKTGSLLRRCREQAGLTQKELADRLGCQQPAIARLEAGGVSPNMRTIERIAEALGLELQWQMVSRDRALNEGAPGIIRQAG
jgi:transcriptional regulator with XRE-family HTH domain